MLRDRSSFTRGFAAAFFAAGALYASSVPAQAQAVQQELTPLKFGTSGGVNTAILPVFHAKEAGFFEKHGLDVEIVQMTDDSTAVQGLIAGEFDLLYTGAGTGIIAVAKGADLKMVMSHTPWTDYQFLAQKGIGSLKELEGKTIGVSKMGALSHIASMFALQQEGVDVDQVQILAVGTDAVRVQALTAGTIDGTVLNGVHAVQALAASPDVHIIYDVGAAFRNNSMSTSVFATGDAIENKPDAVQAAVTALIEACRDLMSNKAAAVERAVAHGLPEDVVSQTFDLLYASSAPYYGIEGGISQEAVEGTIQVLNDSGQIDETPSFADVVDMQFIDKAVEELGPYAAN